MLGDRRHAPASVAVRGIDLAFGIDGIDGPAHPTPLVWAHGLLGSRHLDDLAAVLDVGELSATRPVIRYDAAGHGSSGPIDDPARATWPELAADQLTLAAALGVDRYVAGGSSMGAATALLAALAEPRVVAGLVLMTPPCAWSTRPAQARLYRDGADLIALGQLDAVLDALEAAPPPDPFVDDEKWAAAGAALADHLRSRPAELTADVLRGAASSDLPAPTDIARIDAPCLVLAWTGDPGHPVGVARQLANTLPDATLVVSSDRHEVSTWGDRIRSFLDRLPTP